MNYNGKVLRLKNQVHTFYVDDGHSHEYVDFYPARLVEEIISDLSNQVLAERKAWSSMRDRCNSRRRAMREKYHDVISELKKLREENARLKAELKNEKYAHERIREVKDVLKAENARLKKQVPVWHTFSEKKPQLRQLILIKYEHKQEYPDKQMDAILWCPMREEELKLDMLTYKEWCEFPTTEESSATEKENG